MPQQHGIPRLDPTLLLPLSYAASRPILDSALAVDHLFVGVVPLLLLGALFSHVAERVLRGLAPPEEKPDALLYGLSFVFQIVGTTSVWLVAELVAVQGGAAMPSLHLPGSPMTRTRRSTSRRRSCASRRPAPARHG